MALSVNTNAGDLIALQNLNNTKESLEKTQLAITTGFKVNGPKDDPSTFAIAQNIRGDIVGMNAVRIALSTGESIVNTAVQGAHTISDLLLEMKGKIVQANQASMAAYGQKMFMADEDGNYDPNAGGEVEFGNERRRFEMVETLAIKCDNGGELIAGTALSESAIRAAMAWSRSRYGAGAISVHDPLPSLCEETVNDDFIVALHPALAVRQQHQQQETVVTVFTVPTTDPSSH